MKKTINVRFLDFGSNNFRETLILRILREKYNVIISEQPDYLFYSVFSNQHLKYKNCIRIFVTTENLAPDYNLCDYSIDYEWMKYGDRHIRFPIYGFDGYSKMFELCLSKHINFDKHEFKKKKSFCSFVYSNHDADPFRLKLFQRIDEYQHVNSGGKYMNNIGILGGVMDKLDFQQEHKFSIACENSSHPGYTTEKLVEAFAAKTIPIYWGDPLVKDVFNEKAFICVSDFDTLEKCVEYIKKIDSDNELYLSILNQPAVINPEENDLNGMHNAIRRFLYNIFDQDLEMAYRRNRIFWGSIYFNKMQRYKKVYDIITLNIDCALVKKIRTYIAKRKQRKI